jgi:hypothetical protein
LSGQQLGLKRTLCPDDGASGKYTGAAGATICINAHELVIGIQDSSREGDFAAIVSIGKPHSESGVYRAQFPAW